MSEERRTGRPSDRDGVHGASGPDPLGHLVALGCLAGGSSAAVGAVIPAAAHVVVRLGCVGGQGRVEALGEVTAGPGGNPMVSELFGAGFAPSGQSPSF